MPESVAFNYSHLSVRDLVEARDMFHAHLINKRNVVATAVGRYLIREKDIDEHGSYQGSSGTRRTLSNSHVVDISWPCILVFVKEWEEERALLGKEVNDLVPKTIFMPDGRKVPVCVVEAPPQPYADQTVDIDKLRSPENKIGGGSPLIVHAQGVDRVSSVGCVVSDGHSYYALSNQHVTGAGGDEVFSVFGIDRQRIGVTSSIALGRVPFTKLYPGWPGANLLVKCDVGLIEIEDVNRWKTDIFTLGGFDELYDLDTTNFDLNLIAVHKKNPDGKFTTESGKVVAYGAISGKMEGEIAALFYRYKSVGGTEFVSDFLISGRGGAGLKTHRGDSGTLWLYEEPPCPPPKPPTGLDDGAKKKAKPAKDAAKDPDAAKTKCRPIAVHWGEHDYFTGEGESNKVQFRYALATCLSNVCRELDVDIIRGWNVDTPYTWGKVGHYTVAALAIAAITNADLKAFMTANLSHITFANDHINAGLDVKNNPDLPSDPDDGVCPLADVPDIIWKQSKKQTWGRRGDENTNHYADADCPSKDPNNANAPTKTLFELCPTKADLTTANWISYYDNIDLAAIGLDKPVNKGLICFRVWQIYDYMIAAMKESQQKDRAAKFLFAAGVLAHYVGDCCQPLHSSYMSDGDPKDTILIDYTAKRDSKYHHKGDVYKKPFNPGQGVHTAYEDHMIDDKIDEIFPAIPGSAVNNEVITPILDGQAAGFAALTLMQKTQDTIQPSKIVENFKNANGTSNVTESLYNEFKQGTIDCLARGSQYLRAIWEAAWVNGKGSTKITNLGKVADKALTDLYRDPAELPSKQLDTIGPLLK